MSENRFYRSSKIAQRRVVVTGLGCVSPLGLSAEDSFNKAVEGVSGVQRITRFDPENFAAQIAGEVKDFSAEGVLDTKDQKKMDLFIQYAMVAAEEAMKDSGLAIDEANAEKFGCFVGVGMGGLPRIQEQHEVFLKRGPGRISPFFIPMVISNLASGHISMKYNAKGPKAYSSITVT